MIAHIIVRGEEREIEIDDQLHPDPDDGGEDDEPNDEENTMTDDEFATLDAKATALNDQYEAAVEDVNAGVPGAKKRFFAIGQELTSVLERMTAAAKS